MGCPLSQCVWLMGFAALLARWYGEVGTFFVACEPVDRNNRPKENTL